MKRLFMIGALALSLAACANGTPSVQQANMNRLAAIESAYGSALAVAVAYYPGRPLCAPGAGITVTNVCADRGVVTILQAADAKAEQALATVRAYVKANPTLDATTLLNAADAAVTALSATQAQTGVK